MTRKGDCSGAAQNREPRSSALSSTVFSGALQSQEDCRRLGHRARHTRVLRLVRPCAAAEGPSPEGARWSDAEALRVRSRNRATCSISLRRKYGGFTDPVPLESLRQPHHAARVVLVFFQRPSWVEMQLPYVRGGALSAAAPRGGRHKSRCIGSCSGCRSRASSSRGANPLAEEPDAGTPGAWSSDSRRLELESLGAWRWRARRDVPQRACAADSRPKGRTTCPQRERLASPGVFLWL